ncbi:MAG: pilus assembly protein PilM [Spirochaetes bacterium]|nr:pilus assembly protein PilM [Spirochaetota bacterium]
MFEKIAAIDVGTSCIKLLTVKTGIRDFQITSFAYEDIDPFIEDREEAQRDALAKLLEGRDLKGYTIYTNLPMEKAIIRNIAFPFSDVEKIAEAIPFEAEENIPFKIEDLSMDFQPLKSPNSQEGRILLAATHKDTLINFLSLFKDFNLPPARMGLESNALFECYRYFNKIENEAIIQLDIGHSKTILNFIENNSLLFTRSIAIGTEAIIDAFQEVLGTSYAEAIRIYEKVRLDLTSLENNLQRDIFRTLGISKPKFQKIFALTIDVVNELIEQIGLTLKSFQNEYGHIDFNRIIISGGGSNIIGLGHMLSHEFELPVVSLPFLEGYEDVRLHSQFPIALGTILSILNRKSYIINFLKGEFTPDVLHETKKIYYLSGTLAAFGILVFVFNLSISTAFESRTEAKYDALLQERFKRYFHSRHPVENPVREAQKILSEEKKDLANLENIVQSSTKIIHVLKDITDAFPRDETFVLKNLVINENVVRFDGTASSSKLLEDYKNKLIESKKFESTVLNTNIKRGNQVGFTMTIKLKETNGKKNESKGDNIE